MKKMRKLALLLCTAVAASMLSGCGTAPANKTSSGENIEIRIGYWPNKDTDPQKYEIYKGYV